MEKCPACGQPLVSGWCHDCQYYSPTDPAAEATGWEDLAQRDLESS